MREDEIFGKIIQERRKAKNISQQELAERIGVYQYVISFIETGKRSLKLPAILKICSALEINPSEIFSVYEKKDLEYHSKKSKKLTK